MTESEQYIQMYRKMHEEKGAFSGRSLLPYAHHVKRLIRTTASETLLDYGCGKAEQYLDEEVDKWWGIRPTLYDPGVPAFSARPQGTFDGVVCTDVLEHIPTGGVSDVLTDLFSYATRFLFVTICCRPARRKLPNGLNAHCTIKPEGWWKVQLDEHRYRLCTKHSAHWPKVHVEFTP